MTEELKMLLRVIGAVSRGEKTGITESELSEKGIDISKTRNLATSQGVDYFYKYGVGCKEEIMAQVMQKIQGREILINFLNEIKEAGIDTLVLKGIALAEAYKEPYLRQSCDTDLFVKECDEDRLIEFLLSKGFRVEKRPKTSQHGHASHPKYGMFETHVKFFQDKLIDYWSAISGLDVFRGPVNEPIIAEGKQGIIHTLETTEHFLFMCMHMMKHQLSMENDIKVILDMNTFGNTYRSQIDWTYIWMVMNSLGYGKTLMATFKVGEKYMGFEHFCERTLDVEDEVVDEYIEIISEYSENVRLADEYHDRYWSKKIAEHDGISGKIKMIAKTIPYLPQYIKNESFVGAMKKGLIKVCRIFGIGNRDAYIDDAMVRRNENFKRLGLM